jgi:PhoH-like ATPase
LGLEVQDYRGDTVPVEEFHSGVAEIGVGSDLIDRIYDQNKVTLESVRALINQFLVLRNGSQSALARVIQSEPHTVVERVPNHLRVFGVEPKNLRQTVAMHLLMDPDVPAVSLMGMAGTGKTFLALAAGLEQVLEMGRYRKVTVYRPLVAVGRQEVGFLPGDLSEKLAPWMAAVHDNLYALFSDVPDARGAIDDLVARDELEMAAIAYLRGRSITGEVVIIDEAQNLEIPTLKVILTRMGRDSKLIFCGDLTQVDNPYISPFGGMAALIEKFKGSHLFGHVTLERSVRSPLAEMAATVL